MANENKIGIIACVNNDRYWDECLYYLSELNIPDGYEVELTEIRDAKSMCSGYNEGMRASDAKYKIYMHQDTFITDRYILEELIDIFKSDKKIGMVGLVGTYELPPSIIPWHAPRVGMVYCKANCDIEKLNKKAALDTSKLVDVETIDGLFMATSTDIPWREDIFDGWDFYDLSQSKEFSRAGYRVIVPEYERPFAVHDDGYVLNLVNYDKSKQKFISEYK